MEDFKWLFYVVVAIIYFIAKSKNKKVAEQTSEGRPSGAGHQPQTTSSKPITFEDLLREIQQGKAPATPKPEPKPIPKPIAPLMPSQNPKYEDYDDSIDVDEKDLEEVSYDYRKQDKIYETYEKAKKEAFERPSLEETMKVNDTVVRYGKFQEFSNEAVPSLASNIAKEFRERGNVRKAFILSEILNRKI